MLQKPITDIASTSANAGSNEVVGGCVPINNVRLL